MSIDPPDDVYVGMSHTNGTAMDDHLQYIKRMLINSEQIINQHFSTLMLHICHRLKGP